MRAGELANLRFIPAHAGNTPPRKPVTVPAAVHPRACGEHTYSRHRTIGRIGSSPRMRGTRADERAKVEASRFIPAHAGNTCSEGSRGTLASVHPRACGEHSVSLLKACALSGSSPRMRGTPAAANAGGTGTRFIPAHAGNTKNGTRMPQSHPVHPRACGEHSISARRHPSSRGSSPRMRGTPITALPRIDVGRFIPAHAGNTSPRRPCLAS